MPCRRHQCLCERTFSELRTKFTIHDHCPCKHPIVIHTEQSDTLPVDKPHLQVTRTKMQETKHTGEHEARTILFYCFTVSVLTVGWRWAFFRFGPFLCCRAQFTKSRRELQVLRTRFRSYVIAPCAHGLVVHFLCRSISTIFLLPLVQVFPEKWRLVRPKKPFRCVASRSLTVICADGTSSST